MTAAAATKTTVTIQFTLPEDAHGDGEHRS